MRYQGPQEIELWKEFFFPIGELIVSFGVLEHHLMIAISHALFTSRIEAEKMERKIRSFSGRVKYLEHNTRELARETATGETLSIIVERLGEANNYRNLVVHNPLSGVIKREGVRAMNKRKYGEHEANTFIFYAELRQRANENAKTVCIVREWAQKIRSYREKNGVTFDPFGTHVKGFGDYDFGRWSKFLPEA